MGPGDEALTDLDVTSWACLLGEGGTMWFERSIAAVAVASSLIVGGCTQDDGTSDATQASTRPEISYVCSGPTDLAQPELPVRIVGAGACGYDDGLGHVTYGVVLQNVDDETVHDLSVAVELQIRGGPRVGRSVAHRVYAIAPGQELGVSYASPADGMPNDLSLQVQVTPAEVVDEPEAQAEVEVSDVNTAVVGSSRSTTFNLTSSYPFPMLSMEVFVVYRDATGTILGGEMDIIDRVEAQGTASHTVTSGYVNPDVTQASVYVNENPALLWPGVE